MERLERRITLSLSFIALILSVIALSNTSLSPLLANITPGGGERHATVEQSLPRGRWRVVDVLVSPGSVTAVVEWRIGDEVDAFGVTVSDPAQLTDDYIRTKVKERRELLREQKRQQPPVPVVPLNLKGREGDVGQ